eukprot:m.76279 g.76279  ORF g.76279 m.76279 type:complete len:349 (+) comp10513_c0_seq2:45-1091(+)
MPPAPTVEGRPNWSDKQGRILTGDGQITQLYTPERGFPFADEELPHHHLRNKTTTPAFRQWRKDGRTNELIAGAWCRPLFVGGWEHSDSTQEKVFNLQTRSLFIDIRIPQSSLVRFRDHTSLDTMSADELVLFAQRHAFAGYSVVSGSPPRCVRHHAIDWNYVGAPRPRPNKWRIEMGRSGDVWKEWGWPTDQFGQHVYMERWERLPNGSGKSIALRRSTPGERDAFLIVVGDHFNYIVNRTPTALPAPAPASLGAAAAKMARDENRAGLEALLGLRAGHGTVSSGWRVDAALHPWEEGLTLFGPGDITVSDAGEFAWHGQPWEMFENDFTIEETRALFLGVPSFSKL